MTNAIFNHDAAEYNDCNDECVALMKRIEEAYDTYRLSELYLKDVNGDYGKQKIAKLRYEFARHELSVLLEEAAKKGVKVADMDIMKRYLEGR